MQVQRCVLCENDFRKESLKDGKCVVCQKEHPDCKTRNEMMMKAKPVPNKMGDDLTEETVRALIESAVKPLLEKLEELTNAELKTKVEEKRVAGTGSSTTA